MVIRKKYQPFVALSILVALCLLYPLWNKDSKFPYQGRWFFNGITSQSTITVSEDGSCQIDYFHIPSRFYYQPSVCHYEMGGRNINFGYVHRNFLWRNGHTATAKFNGVITPEKDGQILSLTLHKIEYVDNQTGQITSVKPTSRPTKFQRQ